MKIGRRRIARIMRQQRIVARYRKRRSSRSDHDHPIAPNLLQDRGYAQAMDEIWRTDISYVSTDGGWLSVAAIMDAYSRKIVGWSCASTWTIGLCLQALKRALLKRGPPSGSSITPIAASSKRCGNADKRL
jgi:transposase InsO family protein